MDDEIIYIVDANPDGSLACDVIFAIGEEGELPSSICEAIRKELGLDDDEEPIFESNGKGGIIIKKG